MHTYTNTQIHKDNGDHPDICSLKYNTSLSSHQVHKYINTQIRIQKQQIQRWVLFRRAVLMTMSSAVPGVTLCASSTAPLM